MVDDSLIREAAELLARSAPPGSQVILFGSRARGTAGPKSDIDYLVVEPEVRDRVEEMVRLRAVLQPLARRHLVPVDLVVVSREKYAYWNDVPNNLYHEAKTSGQVYE
ncbi:MAG: nucleotidyltransferase domain-containing protein [Candidatus Coatesbacteria bacterium]